LTFPGAPIAIISTNDECHEFVWGLNNSLELLLKTEYDLPADQMVGCFSITGFANARLHFMTFVDFGFACGYATIFRLFIQQRASEFWLGYLSLSSR
jgi:hypothetical protein